MPCGYIVGFDGDWLIRCGADSKDREIHKYGAKKKVVSLCDMHYAFHLDAEIRGLFLNGKYRTMKEVKAIVKEETRT